MAPRKKILTQLVASFCEVAGASLVVCLLSTLTAPAILALQTQHGVTARQNESGDYLRLYDRNSAADGTPLVRKSVVPVSHSFVSTPASTASGNRKRIPELLTNLPKTEFLDMYDLSRAQQAETRSRADMQQMSADVQRAFGGLVRSQTNTVDVVGAAVTQAIGEVSESVAESLAEIVNVVPAVVVASSDELQKQIELGGVVLIESIQRLAAEVTTAAAKATTLIRDVALGRHPKYRLGTTLKRWRRVVRDWGKGRLARLRGLGASLKRRARKLLQRRRGEGGTKTESEAPPYQGGSAAPFGGDLTGANSEANSASSAGFTGDL